MEVVYSSNGIGSIHPWRASIHLPSIIRALRINLKISVRYEVLRYYRGCPRPAQQGTEQGQQMPVQMAHRPTLPM